MDHFSNYTIQAVADALKAIRRLDSLCFHDIAAVAEVCQALGRFDAPEETRDYTLERCLLLRVSDTLFDYIQDQG